MDFYKTNADDFSRTRYKIWSGVKQFLNSIPSDSIILDAGCGNGKNMLETDHTFIAYDSCNELLNLAKTKAINLNKSNIKDFICGDVRSLPFESNSFDAIMSIAVIHHIMTYSDRLTAFSEIIRVCKPGGSILITVWKAESNPVFETGLETTNNSNTEYSNTDRLIQWKTDDKISYRFYHFFTQDEIDTLTNYLQELYSISISIKDELNNYYLTIDKH